jgi:cell division protein FtsZ
MALKINVPESSLLKPKISIFGVGGAGGNALNNMISSNLEGVEFIAANTDAQALSHSLAANKIQLGLHTTKGLGAGSFPDRGKAAAEENIDEIKRYLEGCNMIFITAGMGGGTGTGAAPVIAKLAKENDILTVGVVTKPFQFEGKYRMEAAEAGIEELKKCVDTLIVIPNQNLFRIANEQTTFESAFKMADNVLHAGVRGVTDLITMPGLVNLDFADIRTIMTKMGKALMGTGEASGENRAVIACEEAISNPLLDDISIRGAKGVLVNMTGGPDMTLFEADLAVNTIKKEVDPNANIIFGSAFNENMKGKIRISIVATGIDENEYYQPRQVDNITKSRSQMVHEVNSQKQEEEKVILAAMKNKKTFFDPGQIQELQKQEPQGQEPQEVTNKIVDEEFSAVRKNHHPKDIVVEEYVQEIEIKNDKDKQEYPESYSQSFAFEEKDVFDRVSESIHSLEKKVQEFHPKAKKVETKKAAKKEGFSLFGFMGGSKNNDKNHEDVNENLERKSEAARAKTNKKQTVIIEDEEEDDLLLMKSNNSAKANHPKHKAEDKKHKVEEKHVDKSPDKGDFSAEDGDDVLNVPAFFRRHKND